MTSAAPLRLLLVGYGRMGLLVDRLAEEYGAQVVGRITSETVVDRALLPDADVAIDFSTADAVVVNAPRLAASGLSLVIGTTGWKESEARVRAATGVFPVGVIAAPNFAIGVNAFSAISERAAELLARRGFSPWIHEAHHADKKDAPSGTALALQSTVEAAGGSPANVSSTRAGHIPGTHTVGFDSQAESITLTHVARDRSPFARGALEAARWIHGRHGWFTMREFLGF